MLRVASALRLIQSQIRWKPGSLERHLNARRKRKHLPPNATSADYERVISRLVADPSSQVYIYQAADALYVAIVEASTVRPWLVMFDLNGLMETAFIVENPIGYLNKPEFSHIGAIQDMLES